MRKRPDSGGGLLTRHLAVAVELGPFVQYQARRGDRASDVSCREHFNAFAGDEFAADRAGYRDARGGDTRGHHSSLRDYYFISGDFAFGLALNLRGRFEIEFAGNFGAFADT